jgi:hypothetical protein
MIKQLLRRGKILTSKMPKRSDGWWINDKEEMRYCVFHKKYYSKNIGCQECYLEHEKNQVLGKKDKEAIELKKCNNCGNISLCWNTNTKLYECLNSVCGYTTPVCDSGDVTSEPNVTDYSQGEIAYDADSG